MEPLWSPYEALMKPLWSFLRRALKKVSQYSKLIAKTVSNFKLKTPEAGCGCAALASAAVRRSQAAPWLMSVSHQFPEGNEARNHCDHKSVFGEFWLFSLGSGLILRWFWLVLMGVTFVDSNR